MNLKKLFVSMLFVLIASLSVQAENYPYRSDILWVTVPDHADWLYRTGEQAKIEIQLYRYGIPQDGVEVSYTLGQELLPSERQGSVKLKNGRAVLSVGTMRNPGFLDCVLKADIAGKSCTHHVKIGFSPEKLRPYTQQPTDFVEFWNKAKSEAEQCQMAFTTKYVPEYSNEKVDCYLIKLQCYKKGQHVYGYLTRPKAKGKYPVVLCPPGAGVKTLKEPMRHRFYAEQGFIRLEMEIHGLNPELSPETFKDLSASFGDYLLKGLDDRDNYYMKKVYLACVRAIDYLTSLDEWDGKNVIVQGGSQGGALALITAGLDSRVTLCVANHPALSDMAGYKAGRADGYPHFFTKLNDYRTDTPEKLQTMAYYDVVNFARQINIPVYLTWGYNDDTCPPTTSYIVYNTLTCPKKALITPINEHWVSETTEHTQLDWIKSKLK